MKLQPQVERQCLVIMLGNDKVVVSVLKYLSTIDIRRRERVRDKELEYKQKNNQVDKDFLE